MNKSRKNFKGLREKGNDQNEIINEIIKVLRNYNISQLELDEVTIQLDAPIQDKLEFLDDKLEFIQDEWVRTLGLLDELGLDIES